MANRLKEKISGLISAVSGSPPEDTKEMIEAVTKELTSMDDGIANTVLSDPNLRSQFMDRVRSDLTDRGKETARIARDKEATRQRVARGQARQEKESDEFDSVLEATDTSVETTLYIPPQLRGRTRK